jgi:hypothetical protein
MITEGYKSSIPTPLANLYLRRFANILAFIESLKLGVDWSQ